MCRQVFPNFRHLSWWRITFWSLKVDPDVWLLVWPWRLTLLPSAVSPLVVFLYGKFSCFHNWNGSGVKIKSLFHLSEFADWHFLANHFFPPKKRLSWSLVIFWRFSRMSLLLVVVYWWKWPPVPPCLLIRQMQGPWGSQSITDKVDQSSVSGTSN